MILFAGLSPYPAAWSELTDKNNEIQTVKIFRGTPVTGEHHLSPGSVETDGRSYLRVAARDGFIQIERIQLQAKKQLPVQEFLRGFPQAGDCRFI